MPTHADFCYNRRMTSGALIAHVDLDAFFASCEQRDNPEYRGKPLIVGALPGGRGVVAACSYEARVFGIHSAMPISQAYQRCPDGIYVRPTMSKYAAESKKIMNLLDDITPVVEKASIDEAYLDISGLEDVTGSPADIGEKIRSRIFAATGLTASVGIGPNRLIAKLGSEACKPDGLKVVREDEVLEFLAPMPIKNLRGMGKQTLKKAAALHVDTIGELRALPLETLQAQLGKRSGESFYRQARGIASSTIKTDRQRKSISKETTFSNDVTAHDKLRDVLRRLASEVARTARRHELAGKVVTLKIRHKGFDTYTRQATLDQPTNSDRQILDTGWALFDKAIRTGDLADKPVRLIGIGLSVWGTPQAEQTDLFAAPDEQATDQRIIDTLDKLTDKFGEAVISRGLSKHPPKKR